MKTKDILKLIDDTVSNYRQERTAAAFNRLVGPMVDWDCPIDCEGCEKCFLIIYSPMGVGDCGCDLVDVYDISFYIDGSAHTYFKIPGKDLECRFINQKFDLGFSHKEFAEFPYGSRNRAVLSEQYALIDDEFLSP